MILIAVKMPSGKCRCLMCKLEIKGQKDMETHYPAVHGFHPDDVHMDEAGDWYYCGESTVARMQKAGAL